MRYLVNDDDLEDWIRILKEVDERYKDHDIRYIIDEMLSHLDQHLK